MHNAAYEALGLDWVYVALPVADEAALFSVASALRVLPFVGVNVTMPYKQAALSICDEVGMPARMAGGVNTIHVVDNRLIGYNTDGRGLLEALEQEVGFRTQDRSVVLLGAGGAAGSAFVAFVLGRASRITVANRDASRAEELVERMEPHLRDTEAAVVSLDDAAEEAVRAADLVVNATPLGMTAGDPSPIPTGWLREGQVVADLVYGPQETPLVAGARAAGAVALDGLGMLVAQGGMAIDIWAGEAGVRAPRDVMRAAAEEALLGDGARENGEVTS